jgi:hypothetical protein
MLIIDQLGTGKPGPVQIPVSSNQRQCSLLAVQTVVLVKRKDQSRPPKLYSTRTHNL